MLNERVIIDRTRAPLDVENMNNVRSLYGDSHKKCSKCGAVVHISELHSTKRIYKNKVYHYTRADCRECRSVARKDRYRMIGK